MVTFTTPVTGGTYRRYPLLLLPDLLLLLLTTFAILSLIFIPVTLYTLAALVLLLLLKLRLVEPDTGAVVVLVELTAMPTACCMSYSLRFACLER